VTNEEYEEFKKKWDSRLASATPMFGIDVDLPMKVFRDQAGGLSIDCPSIALAGFDRIGIVRVHLTDQAVSSLKQAFSDLEKNPDVPCVEIRRPSAN
jgi:hypothetical protein